MSAIETSNARTKAIEPSKPRSPQDVRDDMLAKLMSETRARYPHEALTEKTADVYLDDWGRLADEFGGERFMSGLYKAIQTCRFFPLPADIREAIASECGRF